MCKNPSAEDPKAKNSNTPKTDVVTANGSTKIISKDLLVFEVTPKAGQRIWHMGYL